MFPREASPLLLIGFPALAVVLVSLVLVGHWLAARRLGVSGSTARRRTRRFLVAVLATQAGVSALAFAGVLSRFDARPPPLLLLVVFVAGSAQLLARSVIGRTMQDGLPLAALVGFHAFRLPLELVMHRAATEGVMPPQMTFTGWNFDVVSGGSAIVVAALVGLGVAGRRLVLVWNALGTALLLAIVVIAIASTPVFAAFGRGEALNTFIAYLPFTTLPTVMVALAMAGHLVLWRRLLAPTPTVDRAVSAPTFG